MKVRLLTGALGAACWFAYSAHGIKIPFSFAITNAVRNEFGDILPGTSVASPLYGIPHVQGAVVQILDVSFGVFPPDTDGIPHPSNTVVLTTRIGEGVDPHLPISGMSSGAVDAYDRTANRTNVFVMARVFNKPTLDESSFYADSQVFNVPFSGAGYKTFFPNIIATTNELDASDADDDGLSRSWEKSYGTDPDSSDTDNDGMIDGHEIRAGTNPLDGDSLLIMVKLQPHTGNNVLLTWDAVPGKTYQVQFIEAFTDDAVFSNVNAVVTAAGDTASTVVTNGLLFPQSIYRVFLVE